ncbi:Fic family protein [Brachybacterium sp. J153]|uniref:Fic family protein n=1 Tax=Brachybacterium sp. J153 TaxID=3116488 RepID=UPI002E75D37A|nr:Fic family protein [Brachybacterium sp. J153]MEE1617244.1 Fic family protein [Brachybacterium sp. J153]
MLLESRHEHTSGSGSARRPRRGPPGALAGARRRARLPGVATTRLGSVRGVAPRSPVPAALEDLIRFLSTDELPVLLHAAIAHAQFETIHPFVDGNRRTGRALVHALLRGKGMLRATAPLSAGLLTDLEAYTAALTAFRAGDARPIVEEFSRAARYAAVTGTALVDDLAAQLEEARELLSGVRRHALALRVLPLLVAQPIVNAAHLRRELDAPAMSVQRALDQLTASGVLEEATGRSRSRVWQHRGILAVLDDYAEQDRRAG